MKSTLLEEDAGYTLWRLDFESDTDPAFQVVGELYQSRRLRSLTIARALFGKRVEQTKRLEFLRRWNALDDDARAMLEPHLKDAALAWLQESRSSVSV